MDKIKVKAYGKILVFGAYSILEPGNLGLVVNINKGTTTEISETKSGRAVFNLKNFKITLSGERDGHELNLKKTPEIAKYIKTAVENTYMYLKHNEIRLKNIKLESMNDPELNIKDMKTGFGSSATSTVSGVATVLKLHGVDNRELVYKIARYSHYKAQENVGSGFDISSSCFGSHFFVSEKQKLEKNFIKYIESSLPLKRQDFFWPINLKPVFIFTGKSASTKKLVKKVMKFKSENREEYNQFMKKYNQINIDCKIAFEENKLDKIKHYLEKSWKYRKLLGNMINAKIEPDQLTNLMSEFKLNGTFTAGLMGAGGGDTILAICKDKEHKEHFVKYLIKKGFLFFSGVNITNQRYEFLKSSDKIHNL